MGHVIDADYSQQFLLPPCIEDWVPPDATVRYVRTFVEQLKEQGLELKELNWEDGRPPYSRWLLLRIWMFAYLEGVRSTRGVERALGTMLPMIWLAGGHRPDHNTLWRFWREHETTIRQVVRASVRVAMELDLVGFVLHAVDGTKIQGAASTRKALKKGDAEKLLQRLDARIGELEAAIAEAGSGESEVDRLKESLTDRTALREKVAEALRVWPVAGIEPKQNLTELDARMMKGLGLGYNAQTVVDAGGQIIIAQDVVAEANDEHQLVPMLDHVKAEYGKVAAETLGDGGYNTVSAVGEAEQKAYPVIVANSPHEPGQDAGAYHASRFHYDELRDVVICPEKQDLRFERETRRERQPYAVRIFRGHACRECPVRDACTKESKGRSIEVSPYQGAVQRQREKRRTAEGQALYKKRLHLVERPFAVIKRTLGFVRFRMKTIEKARDEWAFVCGVFNMMQIMAIMRVREAI
ncbi:MAG TPA: IS1182 family transposase [Gemmatimonadota bacterium]|nr:IS1182 family transposase [Gemmatimonadota bacterium]